MSLCNLLHSWKCVSHRNSDWYTECMYFLTFRKYISVRSVWGSEFPGALKQSQMSHSQRVQISIFISMFCPCKYQQLAQFVCATLLRKGWRRLELTWMPLWDEDKVLFICVFVDWHKITQPTQHKLLVMFCFLFSGIPSKSAGVHVSPQSETNQQNL